MTVEATTTSAELVTRGSHALAVTADGDLQPAEFTQARGHNSLLGDGSFLLADVLPGKVAVVDGDVGLVERR